MIFARGHLHRSEALSMSSATFDSTPGQDHVSCPLGGPSSVSPHSRRTPSTARDRAPIMRVARPGPVTSDDQHGHAVEVVHRDRRDEDAAGGPLGSQSVRALSPAVNHPPRRSRPLGRIEGGLLRLAGRPLGPAFLPRRRGAPRITSPSRNGRTSSPSPSKPSFTGPGAAPADRARRLNALSTGHSRPRPRNGGPLSSCVRRPWGT